MSGCQRSARVRGVLIIYICIVVSSANMLCSVKKAGLEVCRVGGREFARRETAIGVLTDGGVCRVSRSGKSGAVHALAGGSGLPSTAYFTGV